ncbi:MAG: PAS domain-containing protein [Spirochaetales bacterium]|nr:PAS domain-containing protein [Spirochaetales bacterium]
MIPTSFHGFFDRLLAIPEGIGMLRRVRLQFLGFLLVATVPAGIINGLVVYAYHGVHYVMCMLTPIPVALCVLAVRRRVPIAWVALLYGLFMQALFLEGFFRTNSAVALQWFAAVPSLITFTAGAYIGAVFLLPLGVVIALAAVAHASGKLIDPDSAIGLFGRFFEAAPATELFSYALFAVVLYVSAVLVNLLVGTLIRDLLIQQVQLNDSLYVLRQKETQLRAETSMQHALLRTVPVPVFIKDSDYRFTAFSDAFLDFMNLKREQLLGHRSDDVFPPDSADVFVASDQFVFENGGTYFFSHHLKLPDGTEKDIRVLKTCFSDEGSAFSGIIGVVIDDSEKMSKERKLQNLVDTRRNALALIGHDLRGPLGSILSLLDMVADGSSGASENLPLILGEMRGKMDALWKLMNELVDWANAEGGLSTYDPEPVECRELVAEAMSVIRDAAAIKGVSLRINAQDSLIVYGDRRMLATVFRNLASNAIKFTPPGGTVTLTAKALEGASVTTGSVVCAIADTGVGMSDSRIRDFMMDSFLNPSRGTEGELGAGMGLQLCKAMVDRHRGSMRLESSEGRGTIVTVTLPGPPQAGATSG